MKVGLVLGGGGVLGGAWLTGGLHALTRETEWDPARAEYIVGTSAGSMIGALVAAGVPPWFMVAHSRGESFEGLTGPDGRPAKDADRAAGAVFRFHRGLPGLGPGSLRMACTALANPLRHTPLQLLAGWLPNGLISTDSLKEIVGRAVPGRWVEHPNFWAVACDYGTGRRIAFGRLDAPRAEIGDAVAASCAIPGFYRPVKIGRRRYVDGGVCSPSNLDLVAGRGLDLVICLNPLSSGTAERDTPEAEPGRPPLDPRDWLGAISRRANAQRVAHEARKVRRFGTEVVLVEPTPADHEAMGRNLMSAGRRQQVIETAERTVLEQLRRPEARALLADLPRAEPHKVRRPDGPPSSWPPIGPVARPTGERAA
ncbi:MAG: patatin-like phospholipase family protein [Thermoleophilaceae bacterium]